MTIYLHHAQENLMSGVHLVTCRSTCLIINLLKGSKTEHGSNTGDSESVSGYNQSPVNLLNFQKFLLSLIFVCPESLWKI